MTSRKKENVEIYVPRGRRSEGESSNGERSPSKIHQEGPSREPPPNCCEDDEGAEDGELEDSPLKNTPNSSASFNSNSSDWRSRPPVPDISGEFQFQRAMRVDRQNSHADKIPVRLRKVASKHNYRREQEPIDDYRSARSNSTNNENPIKKFLQANTPYIDSHCHTDFMYSTLYRTKYPQHHEGIESWIDKYPEAFPRAFCGLIANFIKPDLFCDEDNNEYDIDWVSRELQSHIYLGSTWGCHPHHVKKWAMNGLFWQTLEYILTQRKNYKVVAVGECGIDLHRCESSLEDQRLAFDKHVALAYKHQLPLVVHCRNGVRGYAEDDCLNILKKHMEKNHPFLKIHRHCFTENWSTAKKWLRQCPDVHFGFTGAVQTFNEEQIEAVRRIPLDRILLETDGPYFKPKCYEGIAPHKICLPGMAIATAYKIAEFKNLPVDEVLRATYNNTKRVYQLPVY